MSAPEATSLPPARSGSSFSEKPVSLGGQMNLGELPGQSLVMDVHSLGREVWLVFKKTPDLPGIIFARHSEFAGMISSTQFLKIMSRPFGREIFEGRPVSLLLKELTVEPLILDHKIGIQNAIESCLERPKDHIYEPFLVVNPEKNLIKTCTVQVLMHASAQTAILRNRQMEQILGTVTDGLLLIDRDFRTGSEHSRAVEEMLGRRDISGKLFTDIIAPLIPPPLLLQAGEYLAVLFEKKLIDRLIKSINPIREITVTVPLLKKPGQSGVRHLAFDFERIHNRGEINQVLVRIQDVTRRVQFALELEEREQAAEKRMKLMLQIVSVEPQALKAFLSSCEEEITNSLEQIQGSSPAKAVEAIFRVIHRLKGDAALLQLNIYKDLFHRFEDRLEASRGSDFPSETIRSLEAGLKEIAEALGVARSILEQFIRWNIDPSSASTSLEKAKEAPAPFVPQIRGLIEEISGRLGKRASLHSMVDETLLPPPYHELFKETLIQLVRNSLAHGIESPGQRESTGKPPGGMLQIALEKNSDNFEIIFQDDGAGLNWDRIRSRAAEMGLSAPDEAAMKDLLFTPGFSTAPTVTEDCGRGVGLDLIHSRITGLGGKIAVHSEPGAYCAFQIFLPHLQGGQS